MSLKAALEAYRHGQYEKARKLVTKITQNEPDNENAWGLLLLLTENEQERLRIAKRLQQINPQNPTALNTLRNLGQLDRKSEELIYEMLWDCVYCGTKQLLGKTHRFCPHCGAAQEANKRYFPDDSQKVAVQNHQYFGADRLCPACGTANSAQADFCQQCGSPLEASNIVKTQAEQRRSHDSDQFVSENANSDKITKTKNRWPTLILAIITVFILGLFTFIFWTKEATAILTEHEWQRIIKVEHFAPESDKSWCDQLPREAYDINRQSEVRSYRQVPDGETCDTRRIDRGDGTFVEREECTPIYRKEPVYDMRCYFKIDRWQLARTIEASAMDKKPYWPKVKLKKEGSCLGCERLGSREEDYWLHFQLENEKLEPFRCEFDLPEWQKATVKSHWQLKVGAIMGEVRCDSL
jgi:hypothetical protein